jgi:hypothetical protein
LKNNRFRSSPSATHSPAWRFLRSAAPWWKLSDVAMGARRRNYRGRSEDRVGEASAVGAKKMSAGGAHFFGESRAKIAVREVN